MINHMAIHIVLYKLDRGMLASTRTSLATILSEQHPTDHPIKTNNNHPEFCDDCGWVLNNWATNVGRYGIRNILKRADAYLSDQIQFLDGMGYRHSFQAQLYFQYPKSQSIEVTPVAIRGDSYGLTISTYYLRRYQLQQLEKMYDSALEPKHPDNHPFYDTTENPAICPDCLWCDPDVYSHFGSRTIKQWISLMAGVNRKEMEFLLKKNSYTALICSFGFQAAEYRTIQLAYPS